MHHRSITLRAFALALALGAGALAASCGGDSKDAKPTPDPGQAGAGGTGGSSGGSSGTMTAECGAETCEGVQLVKGIPNVPPYISPCCAEGDVCGLDSSFTAAFGPMFDPVCQARNQPGEDGHGCPDSPELAVPNSTFKIGPLAGCCRTDTKTCGYRLDYLVGPLFNVALGCVDSKTFLDGGTPMDCDPESP